MSEIKSSGIVTPGPISATNFLGAPISSLELGAAAAVPIGSPSSYIEFNDEPVDAPALAPTPASASPPYY